MEKRTSREEIDLLALLLDGVNILRKNFWLILVLTVIGTGAGWLNFFMARKIFENKMMVSSGILTKSYGKILIDNINRYRGENNVKAITEQLKISPEAVRSVRNLKIEDIAPADENKETDRFIITAETYDQDRLQELENGLVYYLENNEFAKIRVEQNKAYLRQVLAKIDEEIKDMEAFKTRIFDGTFFQSTKGNVMFDPTVVNSKILELTKERINVQNTINISNSVQVIDGFAPFVNPSKPRLPYSLGIGMISGLILSGILIALMGIIKLVREADAAKQSV